MIVLRTPKGWTGPKIVDGLQVEGTFRSHQVPVADFASNPEHLQILEDWMRSYRPEELFDEDGRLVRSWLRSRPRRIAAWGRTRTRMAACCFAISDLPNFRDYARQRRAPGTVVAEPTRVLGRFLRDVMKLNAEARNFRIVGPDETASNRLDGVFEVTDRMFMAEILPTTITSFADGRVLEVLSEHMCQGWLEGYLLTGRHGFFSCYEAFIHIVDSMFNQHAKWLKVTRDIPWRRPIASLNYLLTSHVWRQDHNGFSHQDPGFIDHVVNKKADVVRVYLPPDTNSLLSVADHCLRSRHYVNVIVAGKQPALQWLDMEAASGTASRNWHLGMGEQRWRRRARRGDGMRRRRSDSGNTGRRRLAPHAHADPEDPGGECGRSDDPAARSEHPHGLADKEFDALFTRDKPIIFAFHGYPWLIHRLPIGTIMQPSRTRL